VERALVAHGADDQRHARELAGADRGERQLRQLDAVDDRPPPHARRQQEAALEWQRRGELVGTSCVKDRALTTAQRRLDLAMIALSSIEWACVSLIEHCAIPMSDAVSTALASISSQCIRSKKASVHDERLRVTLVFIS